MGLVIPCYASARKHALLFDPVSDSVSAAATTTTTTSAATAARVTNPLRKLLVGLVGEAARRSPRLELRRLGLHR